MASYTLPPTPYCSCTLQVDVDVESEWICEQKWEGQLCSSERHIIQLARAILANPQVLVLHRPVDSLERVPAQRVIDVLGEPYDVGYVSVRYVYETCAQ